jgi:hypothetical protein
VFGAASSVLGYVLVRAGGYALFEKVMSACIAVMFAVVLVTAAALWPGTGAVLRGLVVPAIPHAGGQGLAWTVALIGGVGGTLAVLCLRLLIREKGRSGPGDLRLCRLDLGVAYVMTAFFGLAMVIIGTTVTVEGKGAGLIVSLADPLQGPLGVAGKLGVPGRGRSLARPGHELPGDPEALCHHRRVLPARAGRGAAVFQPFVPGRPAAAQPLAQHRGARGHAAVLWLGRAAGRGRGVRRVLDAGLAWLAVFWRSMQ